MTVLSLRLLPLLPFAVLNYCCGLSSVRPLPFVLGTSFGVLPGTIALVTLGGAVTGSVSPGMLAVSVVCGLIGVLGVVLAGRLNGDMRRVRGPAPFAVDQDDPSPMTSLPGKGHNGHDDDAHP
jgi:uncharacterized membrane protein YdjX (TVP38/TMEM64 family)